MNIEHFFWAKCLLRKVKYCSVNNSCFSSINYRATARGEYNSNSNTSYPTPESANCFQCQETLPAVRGVAEGSLTLHLATKHLHTTVFACKVCPGTAKRACDMTKHIQAVHPSSDPAHSAAAKWNKRDPKRAECLLCYETRDSEEGAAQHILKEHFGIDDHVLRDIYPEDSQNEKQKPRESGQTNLDPAKKGNHKENVNSAEIPTAEKSSERRKRRKHKSRKRKRRAEKGSEDNMMPLKDIKKEGIAPVKQEKFANSIKREPISPSSSVIKSEFPVMKSEIKTEIKEEQLEEGEATEEDFNLFIKADAQIDYANGRSEQEHQERSRSSSSVRSSNSRSRSSSRCSSLSRSRSSSRSSSAESITISETSSEGSEDETTQDSSSSSDDDEQINEPPTASVILKEDPRQLSQSALQNRRRKKRFECPKPGTRTLARPRVPVQKYAPTFKTPNLSRPTCTVCGKEFQKKVQLARHSYYAHRKNRLSWSGELASNDCKEPSCKLHLRKSMEDEYAPVAGRRYRYRCKLCETEKFQLNAIKRHVLQTHHDDLLLWCEACGLQFACLQELHQHQRESHHQKQAVRLSGPQESSQQSCQFCRQTHPPPVPGILSSYCRAMRRCMDQPREGVAAYTCRICGNLFEWKKDKLNFLAHLRRCHAAAVKRMRPPCCWNSSHQINKKILCPRKVSGTVLSDGRLNRNGTSNLLSPDSGSGFDCQACGKKFQHLAFLLAHKSAVHKEDVRGQVLTQSVEAVKSKIRCAICQAASFPTLSDLESHVRERHGEGRVTLRRLTIRGEDNVKRKLLCNWSLNRIKEHVERRHLMEAGSFNDDVSVSCKICDDEIRVFKDRDSCIRHVLSQHVKLGLLLACRECPESCEDCGRVFLADSELNDHDCSQTSITNCSNIDEEEVNKMVTGGGREVEIEMVEEGKNKEVSKEAEGGKEGKEEEEDKVVPDDEEKTGEEGEKEKEGNSIEREVQKEEENVEKLGNEDERLEIKDKREDHDNSEDEELLEDEDYMEDNEEYMEEDEDCMEEDDNDFLASEDKHLGGDEDLVSEEDYEDVLGEDEEDLLGDVEGLLQGGGNLLGDVEGLLQSGVNLLGKDKIVWAENNDYSRENVLKHNMHQEHNQTILDEDVFMNVPNGKRNKFVMDSDSD